MTGHVVDVVDALFRDIHSSGGFVTCGNVHVVDVVDVVDRMSVGERVRDLSVAQGWDIHNVPADIHNVGPDIHNVTCCVDLVDLVGNNIKQILLLSVIFYRSL